MKGGGGEALKRWGLIREGRLNKGLQYIFVMGFRTAYKVIFERAYNQRHFETSYICANADKMNAFGICWFLILP